MMTRLSLAVPLGVVLSASAALACGNSMREHSRPSANESLVAAQQAFKQGDFHRAASLGVVAQREGSEAGRLQARRLTGLAYLKLGEPSKAVSELEAFVMQRKEPFASVKLAEARLRSQDSSAEVKAAALATLEKMTADDLVSDADALAALGRARMEKGDAAGARRACEQALQVEPRHAEAAKLLAALPEPAALPPSQPVKANTKS